MPVHDLVRRPRLPRAGPSPDGSPQPERDDT